MNHDPFDTLRSRNPAPPGSLPEAPPAEATRITSAHPSLRRGLAIAAAAAAVVLVTGGGWLLWSQTGGRSTVVGPTTTTSTTIRGTTTMPATVEDAPIVVVYFLDTNTLVPVARDLSVLNVRPLPDLGPLTVELLLSGPGAWDAAPLPDPVAAAEAQLTTAIPEGTTLLNLTTADGIATVDLSAAFAAASPEALAQVVFTLTGGYQEADAVRFLIEGVPQGVTSPYLSISQPHLVPASASSSLVDPVTRSTFGYLMGAGMVQTPPLGGTTRSRFLVLGVARGSEARVGISVRDGNGTVLWEEVASFAGCATEWSACDGADQYVNFGTAVSAGLVDYGRWVTLTAYLVDPSGLESILASRPVWLAPYDPATDEFGTSGVTTTMGETTTSPGLGDLQPFPADLLTGCAAETARDLAAFEAALVNGPISLQDLCAVVGMPDYQTGSGLFIPAYDLADGSRLFLGYDAPWGAGLIYARLVSPDGTTRDLLGR
jgi:hypothetical protein